MPPAVLIGLIVNAIGLVAAIGAGGRILGRIETLLSQVVSRLEVIGPRVHEHGNALVRLEERLDNLTDRVAILEDTDRQERRERGNESD